LSLGRPGGPFEAAAGRGGVTAVWREEYGGRLLQPPPPPWWLGGRRDPYMAAAEWPGVQVTWYRIEIPWSASGGDLAGPPREPFRGTAETYLNFSYWLLLAVAAALPVAHVVGWAVRRMRRHPPGWCPACGYDLRATPSRCPECGAVPRA
ncbi:MAG TPA: hypothetical protein VF796_12440, partial [Humisphaera sp.]